MLAITLNLKHVSIFYCRRALLSVKSNAEKNGSGLPRTCSSVPVIKAFFTESAACYQLLWMLVLRTASTVGNVNIDCDEINLSNPYRSVIIGQSNYTVFRYTTTGLTACKRGESLKNRDAFAVITKSLRYFLFLLQQSQRFYALNPTASVVAEGHAAVSLTDSRLQSESAAPNFINLPANHAVVKTWLRKFIESQCVFIIFTRTNCNWESRWHVLGVSGATCKWIL